MHQKRPKTDLWRSQERFVIYYFFVALGFGCVRFVWLLIRREICAQLSYDESTQLNAVRDALKLQWGGEAEADRTSGGEGKRVEVSVDLGGGRLIKITLH